MGLCRPCGLVRATGPAPSWQTDTSIRLFCLLFPTSRRTSENSSIINQLQYSAWAVAPLPRPLFTPIFERNRDRQVKAALLARTLLLRSFGSCFLSKSSNSYRMSFFSTGVGRYIRSAAIRGTALLTLLAAGTSFSRGRSCC